MNIRNHRCWPLIEEVGLKKLYMDTLNKPIAPKDLLLIDVTLRAVIGSYGERRDFLVKQKAVECLVNYAGFLGSGKSLRGMEMYSYGIPPATRKLFEALHDGRREE